MGNVMYQLGSNRMSVRSLDRSALDDLPDRFGVLLPAVDLTQLPKTLDVVLPLIRAGCADVILAGPRAEAYRGQVSLVIEEQGLVTQTTAYEEMSDACNAALLGALLHNTGVALVADEPQLRDELRGVAQANGWTAQTEPAPQAAREPAKEPAAKPVKKAPPKKPPAKKPPAKKKSKKS